MKSGAITSQTSSATTYDIIEVFVYNVQGDKYTQPLTHGQYHLISPPPSLSLTQKSRGLGACTEKEISKRAGDWAGVIRKGNYC